MTIKLILHPEIIAKVEMTFQIPKQITCHINIGIRKPIMKLSIRPKRLPIKIIAAIVDKLQETKLLKILAVLDYKFQPTFGLMLLHIKNQELICKSYK